MRQVNYTNEANEFGYEHKSTISCDMTACAIRFEFDINQFEPGELVDAALEHFTPEITEFITKNFGDDAITGDGYDSLAEWFGMGSYALMELGLQFDFKYSDAETTMIVSC